MVIGFTHTPEEEITEVRIIGEHSYLTQQIKLQAGQLNLNLETINHFLVQLCLIQYLGHTYLNIIHCLSEIQIYLGILYFIRHP